MAIKNFTSPGHLVNMFLKHIEFMNRVLCNKPTRHGKSTCTDSKIITKWLLNNPLSGIPGTYFFLITRKII